MSHFTVLAVTPFTERDGDPDVESWVASALERYDENREVAPYENVWDAETVQRFLTYYGNERAVHLTLEMLREDDELFLELMDSWCSCVRDDRPRPEIVEGADGSLTVVTWTRYNPESKWDWFQVGGRWNGDAFTEPPDWESMTEDERKEAGRERYGPYGLGASNLRNVGLVKELRPEFQTFAVLTPEGEWVESARMGWWGFTSNENDEYESWYAEFIAANADHVCVLLDVHI